MNKQGGDRNGGGTSGFVFSLKIRKNPYSHPSKVKLPTLPPVYLRTSVLTYHVKFVGYICLYHV